MSDSLTAEPPIGAEQVAPLRAKFTRESFLERIGADLRALLGADRVQRIALYGSRARGDARDDGGVDDSDWDVAVFLRGDPPTREERDRLYAWTHHFNLESGWDVSPTLFGQNAWEHRTIFMHNLRLDLVDL